MLNLNFNVIGSKSFEQERGDGFNPFPVQLLLVGGGGSGGDFRSDPGRGGGAGGFISASWTIPALTTFDVIVGAGGTGGTLNQTDNGDDSKLVIASTSEVVFNAIGGGGGAAGQVTGSSGGSSGGSFSPFAIPVTPCIIPSDAVLAANTGSVGGFSVTGNLIAAGGGARTSGSIGNNYGLGYQTAQSIVSGSVPFGNFAEGGPGNIRVFGTPNSGTGGGGGTSTVQAGTDGGSGIFAIRYAGLPKATGGTITQSGGFTTHLFLSSSQLVVSGRTHSNP